MTGTRPFIAVVDDDESVRESLPDLIREFGYEAQAFSSAEAFLASDGLALAHCLVADIAMPGMSGLDLQKELIRRERRIPIIFITAHGDADICARLRQRGAIECLLKPFSDTELQEALALALRAE